MNKTNYTPKITKPYHDVSFIKGSIVDLKLIRFYDEVEIDDLPFYEFEILVHTARVGYITLRLGYQDSLLITGHVGYDIEVGYQGYHYSYHALEMIKKLAKRHGYEAILMTTESDNLASQKIIQYAKGVCISKDVLVPKDHIYYVLGKKSIDRYSIDLSDQSDN